MRKVIAIVLGILALATLLLIPAGILVSWEFQKLASDDPTVFKSEIAAFEKADREKLPPEHALLFVGSSSIRFWSGLEEQFSPLPVINRGFGGSKVRDILHYADRIIIKYNPEVIVFFAGTNDIAGRSNDKSPEEVFDDFKKLARLIHERLPETWFIFLPVTPTSARWEVWPHANRYNEMVQAFCQNDPQFIYVNATPHFLDASGKPRKELLWYDGVHLNARGYSIWTPMVKQEVERLLH